jgi:hypothetical protein
VKPTSVPVKATKVNCSRKVSVNLNYKALIVNYASTSLMNMPMMDVGPVRVRVSYRFVLMKMVMAPIAIFNVMLMPMVFIVLMGM